MSLKFSLIICTYKRADSLRRLLNSIKVQTTYPNEILVIDGSPDDDTKDLLGKLNVLNLKYHKVTESDRGLTKQRNYGINLVDDNSQIICFLDDDVVLKENYFDQSQLSKRQKELVVLYRMGFSCPINFIVK